MPLFVTLGLGLIALSGAPSPSAQEPCIARAMPAIQAAGTRADSLELAERYLADPPGGERGCGQLLAGYLLGMTSTPAETEWRERQRATALLESALRSVGEDPRLFLAMAKLLYNRQARTDAIRMLDRTLDRRDSGLPLSGRELALVHFLRGQIHQDAWRDWRSYGQLKQAGVGQWRCSRSEVAEAVSFSSTSDDHTWLIPVNQLCPDLFSANMAKFFDARTNLKRDELENLEAAFGRALSVDSLFLPAAEALLGEWVYLREWEKAEGLARRLLRLMPGDHRPHLYLALVLHETGRDSLAGPEFGKALMRMPDSQLAVFEDVTSLLLPQQLEWLTAQDSGVQQFFRAAFWTSLDPLYLTSVNERKLEHYARVVAADLMFGSPALQEPGWKSFAGQMWIRYGRPAHMWELQVPSGRVAFWDLGPGPDVSFLRGFAYKSYRPTDEAVEYAGKLAKTTPQIYATTALFDSVIPLPAQIVRGLRADGKPELLIYTAWPEGTPKATVAGLLLLDLMFQPVAQWRGQGSDRPGLAAELDGMAPGSYSLTVEVWDRATRRLHRLRDSVSTLAIADSAFGVSDLLMARAVAPIGDDDEAAGREHLAVTPIYGTTVTAGDPVGLVWEVYRLRGNRNGRIGYRVSIEVLDAGKQPVLSRVLRGIGLRGERRGEAKIEYESSRPLVDGRAVEWLELTSELKPGDYRIVLRLEDRDSRRVEVRERALTVR